MINDNDKPNCRKVNYKNNANIIMIIIEYTSQVAKLWKATYPTTQNNNNKLKINKVYI